MCLIVRSYKQFLNSGRKKVEAKVANKDIICYKFARVQGNKYIAPFRGTSYTLNDIMISPVFGDLIECSANYGFHSFSKMKDAKLYATNFMNLSIYKRHKVEFVVLRCIIPKGSLYYKGTFSEYSSYISDKLKITKVTKVKQYI